MFASFVCCWNIVFRFQGGMCNDLKESSSLLLIFDSSAFQVVCLFRLLFHSIAFR